MEAVLSVQSINKHYPGSVSYTHLDVYKRQIPLKQKILRSDTEQPPLSLR